VALITRVSMLRSLTASILLVAMVASVSACSDALSMPYRIQFSTSPKPLAVGDTTRLSPAISDPSGNSLPATGITWTSKAPTVASVSADGLVKALSVGTTQIDASAFGAVASVTVTVTGIVDTAGELAFNDFSSGAIAPYTNPWGSALDVIDDPTGAGKGKVVRVKYSPAPSQSMERGLAFNGPALRYGRTIWMKGQLFIPTGFPNQALADNRKLIDYQGGGVRMTLHRVGARDLRLSTVDWMNGSEQETIAETTGLTIPDATWTTIEVKMVTNSADNVRDGVLEVYLNGSTTPSYRRAAGLGWITEKFKGGSFFDTFLIGFQLTISGTTAYQEERYWDNVGFSTARLTR
jgi:hypothetical protein